MGGRTYVYRELLLPSVDWNTTACADAWEPATRPGLAIHRGLGSDDGRWVVSHVSSGLALGYGGCPTFADAEAFMVDLLGSGVDWTMTAAEIRERKNDVQPVVRAACERHGVEATR